MNYQQVPPDKDPQLWQTAERRASFKKHLLTYLLVNAGLWILWAITTGGNNYRGIPWPVWSTLGWGIGLASHYIGAYHSSGTSSIEKEYDKLTNQNK